MKEITVEQLAEAFKEERAVTIIDIREDYEFNVGHLKGNVLHIPMDEVENHIEELDNDAETYILCRSGKRASALANYLCTNFNFPNMGYVVGGISAYAEKIDHSIEVQN